MTTSGRPTAVQANPANGDMLPAQTRRDDQVKSVSEATSAAPSDATQVDVRSVATEANRHAQAMNVADIGYGRIHWGNYRDTTDVPGPYYAFLGGLVASQNLRRICEIGTHTGGATRAMHRGLVDRGDARIVTIDVTRESDKALAGFADIVKITGDANEQSTVSRVLNSFADGHRIDLLFIDGAHAYLDALMNFAIYAQALSPRMVVMDDVKINPDMRAVWQKVTAQRPEHTWVDVATMFPSVRAPDVGFGLIVMPENAAVPTLSQPIPRISPVKRTMRNIVRYLASDRLGRI